MATLKTFDASRPPASAASLSRDFLALGIETGDRLLVHTRFSAFDYICGGPAALIAALQSALGPGGLLVMPTQTADLSDPANWVAPPVPESWWPVIRAETPPFDPARTPTVRMGVLPELFRTWPGVVRSDHPQVSFAAWGADAEALLAGHTLEAALGDGSPLARLADAGAKVLQLGTDFSSMTAFHLAEHRSGRLRYVKDGAPMLVEGRREWVAFDKPDYDTDDFEACGAAFLAAHKPAERIVAGAPFRLMDLGEVIAFATQWFKAHRPPTRPSHR